MKIEKFQYHNKAIDWRLEATLFSNLTLLVGVSGVGKTQILQAIQNLKLIASGKPINGVQWDIEFAAANGDEYVWQGEYDNTLESDEEDRYWILRQDEGKKPQILFEQLNRNNKLVIERDRNRILLKGNQTPKLSPFESVISILSQEEDITPAYNSFRRIIQSDFSPQGEVVFSGEFPEFLERLKSKPSHESIKECSLSSQLKIALIYKCVPDLFAQIKERFIEVFPQVEDIRLEPEKGRIFFPSFFEDFPLLQIKEKGVAHWIPQHKISSGMYKTFMHISEMFLWPDGTVVLIDEFENSLGVNCLDVLTEDLLQENRRLQFIVTSHHPYIINNISPKYWKIVTRQGGRVFTEDAAALRLDSSSQKAFTQLLNHEHYLEGIIAA